MINYSTEGEGESQMKWDADAAVFKYISIEAHTTTSCFRNPLDEDDYTQLLDVWDEIAKAINAYKEAKAK